MPNPQLTKLEGELQHCLAGNTTMQAGWEATKQELEEVKTQRDHYLKLSNVRGDSLKKLEGELEQMERDQEQMSLHIQALDTALGEAEREGDHWKQKWEQSLAPTAIGSSPTTATTKTEVTSIVSHAAAPPIAKKAKVEKAKVAASDGSLSLSELAARLGGLGISAVSNARRRNPESFTDYSAKRDPDKVAWRYDEKSGRYYPIS